LANVVNRTVSVVVVAGYDAVRHVDDATKKRLKKQVRARERAAALAALPLPFAELEAMFDMLEAELESQSCDHTRRITQAWLVTRGHDPAAVFRWLDEHGGYCDCEVLANVPDEVEEARKASST
jgi:hypothetical protein